MYLRIEGHLLDVLGESARGDMEEELGIIVTPTYQFLEGEPPVSLAKVVDAEKAEMLFSNPSITVLETVEEANAVIDSLYQEQHFVTDSIMLQMSLQMAGFPEVPGYDKAKPLTDTVNLKALHDAGMSGISKSTKPPYFTE
jgi:hypothetical protein